MSTTQVEMILQALEYEMGKLLDEFSAYMFCFCGFFSCLSHLLLQCHDRAWEGAG